jgi:DNA polymerase-3 subunit gamma/tau
MRERDLKDSGLPQVVIELALVTAAQLPHLSPLDDLLKAGHTAFSASPSDRNRSQEVSEFPASRPQSRVPHSSIPAQPQQNFSRPASLLPPSPTPTPKMPDSSATFSAKERDKEDLIKQEPLLEQLLADSSGEIIEIR